MKDTARILTILAENTGSSLFQCKSQPQNPVISGLGLQALIVNEVSVYGAMIHRKSVSFSIGWAERFKSECVGQL